MEQMTLTDRALIFAVTKHAGQKRKDGSPYITHPMAVADLLRRAGYGEPYQAAALLHDALEDTDATEEEIRFFGEEVLEAVKLVTKEPGYQMEDYIARILANEIASRVKIADRIHNLYDSTLLEFNEKNDRFRRKYIAETRTYYLPFGPGVAAMLELAEASLRNHRIPEKRLDAYLNEHALKLSSELDS